MHWDLRNYLPGSVSGNLYVIFAVIKGVFLPQKRPTERPSLVNQTGALKGYLQDSVAIRASVMGGTGGGGGGVETRTT